MWKERCGECKRGELKSKTHLFAIFLKGKKMTTVIYNNLKQDFQTLHPADDLVICVLVRTKKVITEDNIVLFCFVFLNKKAFQANCISFYDKNSRLKSRGICRQTSRFQEDLTGRSNLLALLYDTVISCHGRLNS